MKKLSYVIAIGGVMMTPATAAQNTTGNNTQNATENNSQSTTGYNSQNNTGSSYQGTTGNTTQNTAGNTIQSQTGYNPQGTTGNNNQGNNQASGSNSTQNTNGNTIQTQSGLRYVDIQSGTGQSPRTGQKVTVHYTGTLENGTKFDSSVDRGQPFTFTIGTGQVIRGWDEGVASMKEGGKRKLIIPSSLGYGSKGAGNAIPPNSTLVFDVELLKVE